MEVTEWKTTPAKPKVLPFVLLSSVSVRAIGSFHFFTNHARNFVNVPIFFWSRLLYENFNSLANNKIMIFVWFLLCRVISKNTMIFHVKINRTNIEQYLFVWLFVFEIIEHFQSIYSTLANFQIWQRSRLRLWDLVSEKVEFKNPDFDKFANSFLSKNQASLKNLLFLYFRLVFYVDWLVSFTIVSQFQNHSAQLARWKYESRSYSMAESLLLIRISVFSYTSSII